MHVCFSQHLTTKIIVETLHLTLLFLKAGLTTNILLHMRPYSPDITLAPAYNSSLSNIPRQKTFEIQFLSSDFVLFSRA